MILELPDRSAGNCQQGGLGVQRFKLLQEGVDNVSQSLKVFSHQFLLSAVFGIVHGWPVAKVVGVGGRLTRQLEVPLKVIRRFTAVG